MAKRRKKNLSTAAKVEIGVATVAAVGGVVAVVIAARRKTPPEVTDGGGEQGSTEPTPTNSLARAKLTLCRSPKYLTPEERVLLRDEVFLPLRASSPFPNNPGASDAAAIVAIKQLCRSPNSQNIAAARQLAREAWEVYTG